MLAAAGLPAYVDEHRPADLDDLRGYFEHEEGHLRWRAARR